MAEPITTIAYIALALSAASAVDSAAQQRKAQREQRRIQKLNQRRERIKAFSESRRALAETQANLIARGASTSSAGSTVPGSIRTQEAANQGFLNTVSRLTGNVARYQENAVNSALVSQVAGQTNSFIKTGQSQGLFSSGTETQQTVPTGGVSIRDSLNRFGRKD
jgi:hypothetical protein